MPSIERWFRGQWQENTLPFYSSVDLVQFRPSLRRLTPTCFPGGFNNLNPDFLPLCVHAAMSAVQNLPRQTAFLLIPENHTRNFLSDQRGGDSAHPDSRRVGCAYRFIVARHHRADPVGIA